MRARLCACFCFSGSCTNSISAHGLGWTIPTCNCHTLLRPRVPAGPAFTWNLRMASMMYQHLPHILGVVGAGQMGSGIAQLAVSKGMQVLLVDTAKPALDRARGVIQDGLERWVAKDKMSSTDAESALARVTVHGAIEALHQAEFVIEAVHEDEELKKSIFRRLDAVTPVQTILASNTSSISITRLAAATTRPHRVVGMHFMHPVPLVPMVELAKGVHTANQTFEAARCLGQHLGKSVCVSEDRPGFVVYRVLMPLINEAFHVLMEGVGCPDDIDKGLRLGTNMAQGPLKLADHIGLDTCLYIMRVLHKGLGHDKYAPCPLLVSYVDAGWLGVKSGKGVFAYDTGQENVGPHKL